MSIDESIQSVIPVVYPSLLPTLSLLFFFFHDLAAPEIYTLSLHDALPISAGRHDPASCGSGSPRLGLRGHRSPRKPRDRKSTRLNSSHLGISYAVFCLKKKKSNAKKNISKIKNIIVIYADNRRFYNLYELC